MFKQRCYKSGTDDKQDRRAVDSLLNFCGFIIFITGIFSLCFSITAWILVLPLIQSLTLTAIGILAIVVGRKIMKRNMRLDSNKMYC